MRPSVNESFRTSEVTARPSVNGGIDNFQPGDRVEINNLNVAPEFNGTMGTLEEWLAAKKKWRVKCDYDGKENKLEWKYLTRVTRCSAVEVDVSRWSCSVEVD